MAAESAEQRGRAVALPRVDMRLLAGLALVAVSVVGGLTLWSAARTTTAVVVAARDIGSGAVIEPEDLALAEARLEDPLAALVLPEAELAAAVGRTATGAIHAGELVVRPDLGSGPVIGPGELAVTIPVVIRMKGTNVDAGNALLRASGLDFTTADTMGEAAERVVALASRPRPASSGP